MARKILLVEDDQSLGATLQDRLSKAQYSPTWCKTLQEAHEHLAKYQFDLVILDVGLPDGSGFDFAKKLRSQTALPFLFVTAQATAEDRLLGYDLGAVEFIPKPFHLREFMLRVEHALALHVPPSILKFETVTIDASTLTVEVHDQQNQNLSRERLAARDFKLLMLLIEKSPQVVSRDEILNQLWSDEEFPSNRTIDNSILRLRQALGERGGTWILSIRGVGYQWKQKGD